MNQKNQRDFQNLKEKVNRMSEKIADWLIGQKVISSDERELYAYAVHCLFSLIYPIAFASVVGIISGMIMESIVMIIPFMIIRKFSGGYHADSFGKCLIISSIVIAGALLIGKNIYNGVTLNALYIVASILLIIFSPIDSINKRLDDDDKMFCKKITIVIVLLFFVITEILWCTGHKYYTKFIEIGVIFVEALQILILISTIKYKTRNYWFKRNK